MNVKRWNLACALALILATMLACKFSFSTANLSSLKISKDKSGSPETSSFNSSDTVYAVADVSNAPGKTKLKARLLYDNVAGQTSGALVPGAETTIDLPGSGTGTFTLTPPAGGWPNGSYKLEVNMLNEDNEQKDQKTGTFTVSGNTAAKPPTTETTNTQAPANVERDATSGDNSMGGFWTLTGEGGGSPPTTIGPWQLTLDEKGTELAGELEDTDGTTVPVTGSRNGDQITLTWGSGAAKFTLTGALDRSGQLSGDFVQGAGVRGKWQARKAS
ncbi:MAG: hypothetical protein ICV68_07500 [Pyrinomonadaceae bacterium]|nr:hypothetical protein [Pyrinomonadaceae bacterium]